MRAADARPRRSSRARLERAPERSRRVRYPGFGGLLSFDVADGDAARRSRRRRADRQRDEPRRRRRSTMESRHRWEGDRVPEGLLRLVGRPRGRRRALGRPRAGARTRLDPTRRFLPNRSFNIAPRMGIDRAGSLRSSRDEPRCTTQGVPRAPSADRAVSCAQPTPEDPSPPAPRERRRRRSNATTSSPRLARTRSRPPPTATSRRPAARGRRRSTERRRGVQRRSSSGTSR